LIGRTLHVSQNLPLCTIKVTKGQIDGGQTTNPPPILLLLHTLEDSLCVSCANGRHQLLIGCREPGPPDKVNRIGVAKGRPYVSQISGGYDDGPG
jgi:hypothetical protein